MDIDSTATTKDRFLHAALKLFARAGYDQTTTSTLARDAGSSESQLIRHFGDKLGLLEALFNRAWIGINEGARKIVQENPSPRRAFEAILALVMEAFAGDPDMATVFLLEGRRIRRGSQNVLITHGYREFTQTLEKLIERGQESGAFVRDIHGPALTSALMSAGEGMLRDRLIARRSGQPQPFDVQDVRRTFSLLLDGISARA